MRKVFFIIIILLTTCRLHAQLQQGWVKTIGKPNKSGMSLSGVTVRVSGDVNAVVTTTDGKFSFPVKEQRFRFSRISKEGYELADRDFLHYDFGYSPYAPVTVAMVSKEELARERETIEKSTRSKLTERFKKEEAILNIKLSRMQVSEENYRKQLLALHEKYDNIDTLVSTLSDRYARTDYDNIDSLRLLINQYIENGELERAQQLILLKGNLDERAKELEETRKLRLQTQLREEKLQKDLADDLYQLSEIARSRQQNDSAYIYLEKRYYTDTTQVKYLSDLAMSYFHRGMFQREERNRRERKQLIYIYRLYNIVQIQDVSPILGMSSIKVKAQLEDKIGDFYYLKENNELAIMYYKKELQTIIDGKMGNEYSPLHSLGNVYQSQKDYKRAIAAYQEALGYCKENHSIMPYLRIEIANTYYLMGDADKALKEYIYAEKNYETPNDSDFWLIKDLFVLQGYIAQNLNEKSKGKDAVLYYEKAIKNAERYYSLTHDIKNIKPIVNLLREQQNLYASRGEYMQMYACAEKAMFYAQLYHNRMPSAYSQLLYAEILCQMANAHANMDMTEQVEQELVDCLKKSEFASSIFKTRYQQLTYKIYNIFAITYFKQGKYKEAMNAINKSISIMPEETQAYMSKLVFLNAVGEKEEMRKVEKHLLMLKEKKMKRVSKTNVISRDPLWDYEYQYLSND